METTPDFDSIAQPVNTTFVGLSDKVPFFQKFGYGLGCFIDMWGHWFYSTFAYLVFALYLGVPRACRRCRHPEPGL